MVVSIGIYIIYIIYYTYITYTYTLTLTIITCSWSFPTDTRNNKKCRKPESRPANLDKNIYLYSNWCKVRLQINHKGNSMKLAELNSKQDEFLCEILAGDHCIPKTKEDLVTLLESFLTMYDFDKHEDGPLFYSVKGFLSSLFRLGEKDPYGYAYISSVMQIINKRKYFKTLSSSTKNREVKAERYLIEHLIKNNWISVSGVQARVTVDGLSHLNRIELINQY